MQKAIITYLFSMINRTSKIDWLNLLSKKIMLTDFYISFTQTICSFLQNKWSNLSLH